MINRDLSAPGVLLPVFDSWLGGASKCYSVSASQAENTVECTVERDR